jgi:hypothetical protein
MNKVFLNRCYLVADRVFRGDCDTKQVYEEGAKEIALSVVSGINCEYKLICWLVLVIHLRFLINICVYTFFQRVFLHMGKRAVERHILWLE